MNPSGPKTEKEDISTMNITGTPLTITPHKDGSCWHLDPEGCWRSVTPKKRKFSYITTLSVLLTRLSCINFKCQHYCNCTSSQY